MPELDWALLKKITDRILRMTLIAVLPPLIKGKLYRWQGILMLALYAVYVVILVTQYGV